MWIKRWERMPHRKWTTLKMDRYRLLPLPQVPHPLPRHRHPTVPHYQTMPRCQPTRKPSLQSVHQKYVWLTRRRMEMFPTPTLDIKTISRSVIRLTPKSTLGPLGTTSHTVTTLESTAVTK